MSHNINMHTIHIHSLRQSVRLALERRSRHARAPASWVREGTAPLLASLTRGQQYIAARRQIALGMPFTTVANLRTCAVHEYDSESNQQPSDNDLERFVAPTTVHAFQTLSP